jgi:hypothetical protein
MPGPVVHLSADEAVAVHALSIERFGADAPRSRPARERAPPAEDGHSPDLAAMAAAFLESPLLSHPFVDANEHVAFLATDRVPAAPRVEAPGGGERARARLMGLLARNAADLERLEAWIRGSPRRLR